MDTNYFYTPGLWICQVRNSLSFGGFRGASFRQIYIPAGSLFALWAGAAAGNSRCPVRAVGISISSITPASAKKHISYHWIPRMQSREFWSWSAKKMSPSWYLETRKTICLHFLSCCCDKIHRQRHLKGEKVHLAHYSKSHTAHHRRVGWG